MSTTIKIDNMNREPTKEEQAQWDQAFAELSAFEDEVFSDNKALIEKLGIPQEEMDILMQDCDYSHHEKISIVPLPGGDDQSPYEESDYFKEIWIEQWSVGMSGDSYEGYIYAKVGKKQWLKIPYYC